MNGKKIKFSEGEKYRGLVSGEVYTVLEIRKPGLYCTISGGMYHQRHAKVILQIGESGETTECSLAMAERLKLERVSSNNAPVQSGMRLPTCAEWDALVEITDGKDDVMHWKGQFSWCKDAVPEIKPYRAVRGYHSSKVRFEFHETLRTTDIGFRPVFVGFNPDSNIPDGTGITAGTLYMDEKPMKVPKNPTRKGDIPCYEPGAKLKLRDALDDPAYQIQAIKARSILIADRALLRQISWMDLRMENCCF